MNAQCRAVESVRKIISSLPKWPRCVHARRVVLIVLLPSSALPLSDSGLESHLHCCKNPHARCSEGRREASLRREEFPDWQACLLLSKSIKDNHLLREFAMNNYLDSSKIRLVRGLVKFVPALAWLFCLALPGSCLASFANLISYLGCVTRLWAQERSHAT